MHKIAIIGQGYVGLPLALELAMHFPVFGFDINENGVAELNMGKDHTLEADIDLLKAHLEKFSEEGFARGYRGTANKDHI